VPLAYRDGLYALLSLARAGLDSSADGEPGGDPVAASSPIDIVAHRDAEALRVVPLFVPAALMLTEADAETNPLNEPLENALGVADAEALGDGDALDDADEDAVSLVAAEAAARNELVAAAEELSESAGAFVERIDALARSDSLKVPDSVPLSDAASLAPLLALAPSLWRGNTLADPESDTGSEMLADELSDDEGEGGDEADADAIAVEITLLDSQSDTVAASLKTLLGVKLSNAVKDGGAVDEGVSGALGDGDGVLDGVVVAVKEADGVGIDVGVGVDVVLPVGVTLFVGEAGALALTLAVAPVESDDVALPEIVDVGEVVADDVSDPVAEDVGDVVPDSVGVKVVLDVLLALGGTLGWGDASGSDGVPLIDAPTERLAVGVLLGKGVASDVGETLSLLVGVGDRVADVVINAV